MVKRDPWIETVDGKCPKWLAIVWKGKLVEIDSKGKIRETKTKTRYKQTRKQS